MDYPESARLATEAFQATGVKRHPDFCALTKGAVTLRSFRRWLGGHGPVDEMTRQYLLLIKSGWRPDAD